MERRTLVNEIIDEPEDKATDSSFEWRSSAAASYGTLPSNHASPVIIPAPHVHLHPTITRSIKDDIEHFDPAGVAALERRLTRRATSAQRNLRRNTVLSSTSEVTLVGSNDPFDFVDCLRGFIKCVRYNTFYGKMVLMPSDEGATKPAHLG